MYCIRLDHVTLSAAAEIRPSSERCCHAGVPSPVQPCKPRLSQRLPWYVARPDDGAMEPQSRNALQVDLHAHRPHLGRVSRFAGYFWQHDVHSNRASKLLETTRSKSQWPAWQ